MPRVIAGAVPVVFLIVLAGTPLPAERVREATRAVLSDSRYQKDLPGGGAGRDLELESEGGRGGEAGAGGGAGPDGRPVGAERWSSRTRRGRGGSRFESDPADGGRSRSPSLPLPGGAAVAIAKGLFWVGVVVVSVLLIVAIARAILNRKPRLRDPKAGATGEDPAASAAAKVDLERPLDDAEALAAAGRFGEAIHVLLLRTFEELLRARRAPDDPALTSREVAARARLDEPPRVALGGLVDAVERSLFGGREPGRVDYERCVERFRTLKAIA